MITNISFRNSKVFTFQASAITPILYKKMFKSDLLMDLTKLSQFRAKLKTDDEAEEDEEMMNLKLEFLGFATEFFNQLAYIMYLQGNFKPDEIWRKLELTNFWEFISNFENNEILEQSETLIALYNGNIETTSELKNG